MVFPILANKAPPTVDMRRLTEEMDKLREDHNVKHMLAFDSDSGTVRSLSLSVSSTTLCFSKQLPHQRVPWQGHTATEKAAFPKVLQIWTNDSSGKIFANVHVDVKMEHHHIDELTVSMLRPICAFFLCQRSLRIGTQNESGECDRRSIRKICAQCWATARPLCRAEDGAIQFRDGTTNNGRAKPKQSQPRTSRNTFPPTALGAWLRAPPNHIQYVEGPLFLLHVSGCAIV
eukprot:SAG31_NODE_437_length_15714_cov_8.527344_11_plen_231_part_00